MIDVLRQKKEEKEKIRYVHIDICNKSNRDRHVKNIHSIDVLEPVLSICATSTEQSVNAVETVATFDYETANAMDVSFLADDDTVLEQSMSLIEKETPIFEVFEPVLNSSFIDEDNVIPKDSDHILTGNGENVDQSHFLASVDEQEQDSHTRMTEDTSSDDQIDFVQELKDRARKRKFDHEILFKNKVLNKIKQDIHNRFFKCSALNSSKSHSTTYWMTTPL